MCGRVAGVPTKRLTALLEPEGFWLQNEANVGVMGYRRSFCRESPVRGCFEILDIYGGREIVVDAVASVIPGTCSWRNMANVERLDQCYAMFPRADRNDWERVLLEVAPARSRALALRSGGELLQRTARARKAAKYYLSLIPQHIEELESYWNQLKELATQEQRELARFSLRSSMLTLKCLTAKEKERAYYAYQVATYVITLHASNAVPLGFFPAGIDAHIDHDLAYCFQIMASCIYGEPHCDLILLD